MVTKLRVLFPVTGLKTSSLLVVVRNEGPNPVSELSKVRGWIRTQYKQQFHTAVAQWIRCCATNRKVAGSIPASVSEFFIDIKSFRSHYGREVESASNRNEYQEYFLGVKAAGAQGCKPYHHPVPLSWNLGTLTSWKPLGHSRPLTIWRLKTHIWVVPHR